MSLSPVHAARLQHTDTHCARDWGRCALVHACSCYQAGKRERACISRSYPAGGQLSPGRDWRAEHSGRSPCFLPPPCELPHDGRVGGQRHRDWLPGAPGARFLLIPAGAGGGDRVVVWLLVRALLTDGGRQVMAIRPCFVLAVSTLCVVANGTRGEHVSCVGVSSLQGYRETWLLAGWKGREWLRRWRW